MEIARILKILWQRRRLVALGAFVAGIVAMLSVYTVSLFPPGLEPRTNVFATASTQLLVDAPNSAFADLENEMTPLEARAGVFARFLATPAAIELISKYSGVPADEIQAAGPYDINLPVTEQEPTAGQRSSQIIGEGALYRLRFENNPILPIVSVFAQAPTTDEAMALANSVPRALGTYIAAIQTKQHTPANRRVVIRPLGDAIGGVVNKNANIEIGLLVFFVVFGAWCMLLVPAQTIARSWRETWSADEPERGARKVSKSPGRGRKINGTVPRGNGAAPRSNGTAAPRGNGNAPRGNGTTPRSNGTALRDSRIALKTKDDGPAGERPAKAEEKPAKGEEKPPKGNGKAQKSNGKGPKGPRKNTKNGAS